MIQANVSPVVKQRSGVSAVVWAVLPLTLGACDGGEAAVRPKLDAPVAADAPVRKDAPPATCGNAICEAGETESSCQRDCPCTAAQNANPDSCLGDEICVAGDCVNAFGRTYEMLLTTGQLANIDATNMMWDDGVGTAVLPDPYVVVAINNQEVARLPVRADTITPTWNATARFAIAAGSSLTISLFDEDLNADDLMFSCNDISLSAADLRVFETKCQSDGNSPAGVGSHFAYQLRAVTP